jgi:CDGSH-type Zn-finger protein
MPTKTGENRERKIVISQDGPYIVSAGIPLTMDIIQPNAEGLSWDWKHAKSFKTAGDYKLCRCGHSKNKPFCDGSHTDVNFDGKETATRQPYARQAQVFDSPTMLLSDVEDLCAFARFCDPGGKIWGLMEQSDDPQVRKLVIRESMHCPSGRLVLNEKKTGEEIEPRLKPGIGVVEDPALGVSGPLYVQGGIRVESSNGTPYEVRNRVTLCRCGASVNKPFCNGSHASIKFRDGLVEFGKSKKQ